MSLGIVFKGPEGIVLAADSRVTLTAQIAGQNAYIPATYDNATKLLRVTGQDYVGAVTYGAGALGAQEPRTAHSFLPEFENTLKGEGRLSVDAFAKKLSDFFKQQWTAGMPVTYAGPDMIFLVGGYDEGAAYGRVFEFHIPHAPMPVEQQAGQGAFGVVWGGQREFTDRLIQGFDDSLPELVKSALNLSDQQRDALKDNLKAQLAARIPYAFLPLQDCVDLSIFLIRTTIVIQQWLVGIRGWVGQ